VSTQNHESRCFLTKIIYKRFCSLLMRHHCMWSRTSYLKAKSTLEYKMHWSIILTLMQMHPLCGLDISRHTCTTQDISHLLQFYRNLPSCAPKARRCELLYACFIRSKADVKYLMLTTKKSHSHDPSNEKIFQRVPHIREYWICLNLEYSFLAYFQDPVGRCQPLSMPTRWGNLPHFLF